MCTLEAKFWSLRILLESTKPMLLPASSSFDLFHNFPEKKKTNFLVFREDEPPPSPKHKPKPKAEAASGYYNYSTSDDEVGTTGGAGDDAKTGT